MFYQKHGRLGIALIAIGSVPGIMWFVALIILMAINNIHFNWFDFTLESRINQLISLAIIPLAISGILIISGLLIIAAVYRIAWLGIATALLGIFLNNLILHMVLAFAAEPIIIIYIWLLHIAFISYIVIMIVAKIAANKKSISNFQRLGELSEKVCTICEEKCAEQWNKCPYCGGVLKKRIR